MHRFRFRFAVEGGLRREVRKLSHTGPQGVSGFELTNENEKQTRKAIMKFTWMLLLLELMLLLLLLSVFDQRLYYGCNSGS